MLPQNVVPAPLSSSIAHLVRDLGVTPAALDKGKFPANGVGSAQCPRCPQGQQCLVLGTQ